MADVPRAGVLRPAAARLLCRACARRALPTSSQAAVDHSAHGMAGGRRPRAPRRPGHADGAQCPMRGRRRRALSDARRRRAARGLPDDRRLQPAGRGAGRGADAGGRAASAVSRCCRAAPQLLAARAADEQRARSPSRPIRLRLASSPCHVGSCAARRSFSSGPGGSKEPPYDSRRAELQLCREGSTSRPRSRRSRFRRGVSCSAFVVRWRLGRRAGRGPSGRGPGIDQSRQRQRPRHRRPGRGGARGDGHGAPDRDRRDRRGRDRRRRPLPLPLPAGRRLRDRWCRWPGFAEAHPAARR